MKLAVVHNLPPGGGRRVVTQLIGGLAAEDDIDLYSVDLGAADRWPDRPFEPPCGIRRNVQIPIPFARGARKLDLLMVTAQLRRVYRSMAALIDGAGYDAVIVNHDQFTSAPAILAMLQTPSIYICHEPRRQSFEYDAARRQGEAARLLRAPYDSLLRRQDVRWTRAAGVVVANSDFAAESLARAYGRDAIVVHLGVDDGLFRAGTEPRADRVLSVGAIDRLKAQHVIVEALALLAVDERPGLDLVYERVDARYQAEVQESADRLGVDVAWHRGVSDEELARHYRTALLTVCTARLEPFGLTTIESIASGTPVVAVREGGFRESVTEGVNGRLVSRSPNSVADGIRSILRGDLARSPELLRGSILPYWSWRGAVERMRTAIASVAST